MKEFENLAWSDRKRTIFGLPISLTKYILLENKFIIRTGLINIKEEEVELYRVKDKKLIIKFWGRIFNYGTVIFHANDTYQPDVEVKNVKNVRKFMATFESLVNTAKDKYRVRGRDMIGESAHEDIDPGDIDDHFL